MTKKEAIEFAVSGKWKTMSDFEKVKFQLYEEKLCMPFDVYHKAVEKVLGHPVFTHEFAFEGIKKEFEAIQKDEEK